MSRAENTPFDFAHVATGGTIDSLWQPTKDTVVPGSKSYVSRYFSSLGFVDPLAAKEQKVRSRIVFRTSLPLERLKDSRDLGPDDMMQIADSVSRQTCNRVLVTCGTYLMPDLAAMIAEHVSNPNIKVVVTGSLRPIIFPESDGGFNLGQAVALLQDETASRVTLVMNGKALDGTGRIIKNISLGRFYEARQPYDKSAATTFSIIQATGKMNIVPEGERAFCESPIAELLQDSVNMPDELIFFAARRRHRGGDYLLHELDLQQQPIIDSRDFPQLADALTKTSFSTVVAMDLKKMPAFKKYILSHCPETIAKKAVILTGSRMPLKNIAMSDAPFQLGYALAKLPLQKPGIYIAVDGRIT